MPGTEAPGGNWTGVVLMWTKTFYYQGEGMYLVASFTVVTAQTKEQAQTMLIKALSDAGIPQNVEMDGIIEIDGTKAEVQFLWNGDY